MNLIDTHNQNWGPVEGVDFFLRSGIVLNYVSQLDMGGTRSYSDYINILRQFNKKPYKRAYEWCAGIGALGFEILGQKLCDHIVFSDYYDLAIKNCYKTAEKNNISDKVTGYITPRIGDIPYTEIWDLVVGNPPHNWSMEDTKKGLDNSDIPEHMRSNMLRTIVDDGMETHKEFFRNIRKHLTDDADVLVWEADPSAMPIIERMAYNGGLKLLTNFPMPTQPPEHKIYYFKPR